MSLIKLWKSNSEAIEDYSIEQIVSMSGDGKLKDNNDCSKELRDYLSQIPSTKLSEYIEYCLSSAFPKSGFVLQDLVNELGRRLDYKVTNGLYKGVQNKVGYDGIWSAPESNFILIEVKTTDAYRLSLDNLVNYKKSLQNTSTVTDNTSILIVVGREDTGELEAQVRGSRHAWDIRLISADALMRLIALKESSEEVETAQKIRSILVPLEYTKLDEMVDVMFTTAKDVESYTEGHLVEVSADENENSERQWQFTPAKLLSSKRDQIVSKFSKKTDVNFIKKSRALYWSSDNKIRIATTISKRYASTSEKSYWYAYHPIWDDFLKGGTSSHFILGCMDLDIAFSIPFDIIHSNLDNLNTTTRQGNKRMYWHIKIRIEEGSYFLLLPKASTTLNLNEYLFKL
ncbi:hypothetical protein ACFLTH_11950 [Bacteroidota bacterium]